MPVKYQRRSDGTTGVIPENVFINIYATATDATRGIWIADADYELVSLRSRFTTASTSGTLMISKAPSGTAVGTNTDMLTATVALSGTANTNASGTPHGTKATRTILRGQALVAEIAGTMTNLAGHFATVALKALDN